jgi:hypothetical protein
VRQSVYPTSVARQRFRCNEEFLETFRVVLKAREQLVPS